MDERLYVVTYDIADQRRWRRVYRLMQGYGQWLQLSVFQCRLNARRRAELVAALEELLHARDDHAVVLDLGPADATRIRVTSIGKTFQAIEKRPTIV